MFWLFRKKDDSQRFTKTPLNDNPFHWWDVTLQVLWESKKSDHDEKYQEYLKEKRKKEKREEKNREEKMKNELMEKYCMWTNVYHKWWNDGDRYFRWIIVEFVRIQEIKNFYSWKKDFYAEVIVKNTEGDYFIEDSMELILVSKIKK